LVFTLVLPGLVGGPLTATYVTGHGPVSGILLATPCNAHMNTHVVDITDEYLCMAPPTWRCRRPPGSGIIHVHGDGLRLFLRAKERLAFTGGIGVPREQRD